MFKSKEKPKGIKLLNFYKDNWRRSVNLATIISGKVSLSYDIKKKGEHEY